VSSRTYVHKSWVEVAAWTAFAVTVPSALWRVLMITGLMPGTGDLRTFELGSDPTAGYVYVFALSLVQLSTAFLTVGLVRPWGERLGRLRIPAMPVVAVALVGGIAVTWLFTVSLPLALAQGHRPDAGHVHGIAFVVMAACYAPIVAWGPLVLVVTGAYARRRLLRRPSIASGTLTA
jgi:nitrate reductase NapE component